MSMMHGPAPSVIWFDSAAYRKDPHVLDDALEALSKADGMQKTYVGSQVQEPHLGFWITIWKSHAHYKRFMKSDASKRVSSTFRSILDAKPDVHHVLLPTTIDEPMKSTVVETVYITANPGRSRESLQPLMDRLTVALRNSKGCHDSSWGYSIENGSMFVGIIGWDSVEAHHRARYEPELGSVIGEIHTIADIKVKYGNLHPYESSVSSWF
jgi:quinol monooxygenase YgiN